MCKILLALIFGFFPFATIDANIHNKAYCRLYSEPADLYDKGRILTWNTINFFCTSSEFSQNAFSPCSSSERSGDSILVNSVYVITIIKEGQSDAISFSKYNFSAYQMNVFDNEGKLMFSSGDKLKDFTGLDNDGRIMKEGTYYMVLHYKLRSDAEMRTAKSAIILLW